MKKKGLALMLALVLCLSCVLPAFAAEPKTSKFTDVDPNAWYATAINALADGGILSGKGDGIFDPNGKITLAELAVICARLKDMPIANEEHWAGTAMLWFGLGTNQYTDDNVNYQYAGSPAYRGDALTQFGSFAAGFDGGEKANRFDNSIIPDRADYLAKMERNEFDSYVWYTYTDGGHAMNNEDIDLAYAYGVTTGMDANHTCMPFNNLTRAEVAQMCYNMGWTTAGCLA